MRLGQDGGIGGGSHRLEDVTSHQERVRPVKERVGSSARDGEGEDGTNEVHATGIFGSRLGHPDGFGCSPVGHAVLDVPLLFFRMIWKNCVCTVVCIYI